MTASPSLVQLGRRLSVVLRALFVVAGCLALLVAALA
jgi:hypothetical protein